jgi:hypothetical protein
VGKRHRKHRLSISYRYPCTAEANYYLGQDLSLLVDLSYSDLQKLQQLGSASQAEQAKFILRNDLEKVWATIKDVKDGRVDIVLDNGKFD